MSNASDTVENADAPKKRGRPAKELINPHAAHQAEMAKEARQRGKNNPVTEKYYRLAAGHKLVLCKRKASGTVSTTFVGSINDKKTGADVKAFVDKLKSEGRLEIKV